MVQFSHKGRQYQQKKIEQKIMISCQQGGTKSVVAMQNGGEKTSNFYEVLSLDCSKFVGLEEIKKAYRCKALKYHPDARPTSMKEESTKRFLEIKMAYETLSDPISREMYDQKLRLFDDKTSCWRENRRGVEGLFPREVWERQLSGLKNVSRQKIKKRIDERK